MLSVLFNLNVCGAFISVKPAPVPVTVASAALKEDDFPSLSSKAVASPMTPAYSAQSKKTSSFQEEDFPALISKVQPLKTTVRNNSAWSNHTPAAKSTINVHPPPQLPSAPSGPQPLSSSTSSSSRRKKKVGDSGKAASARSPPLSDDEGGGLTQQEFRSVPTMLDISSLLTVKGGNIKPPTVTPNPPNQTSNPEPPTSKAGKKKKQKNTAASASSASTSAVAQSISTASVETAAQKENVPDKTWNKPISSGSTGTLSGLANGHPEKSPPSSKKAVIPTPHPNKDPPPEQEEEEFPALMTKKPPPGRDHCV